LAAAAAAAAEEEEEEEEMRLSMRILCDIACQQPRQQLISDLTASR
jgi:hypothetical protein